MGDNREDDRRNFRRFSFQEPVEFKVHDGSEFVGSLSSDLSEGGLKLNLFKFIPLNTQVNLMVHLSSDKTVELAGRIAWVEEVPYSENYRAGVEFQVEDLIFHSRREIRQFLQAY